MIMFRSVLTLLLATSVSCMKVTITSDGHEEKNGGRMAFSGNLITDDGATYGFESIWKHNRQRLDFTRTDTGEGKTYTSFRLNALKNDHTIIEVETADGNVAKMKMKPDKKPPLSDEDTEILENLASSELGQTFVASSKHMGEVMHITGNGHGPAALSFHRMAMWMDRVVSERRKLEAPWEWEDKVAANNKEAEAYNKEAEAFNRDVVAQANGDGQHRELWCSTRSCCNNPCFGRCGNDCNCWWFVCGTCGCVEDCMEHDMYCSCHGMTHYWCLNVFWVGCGNSFWSEKNFCS